MKWRFTLIRERDGDTLVTPDPIGWDAVTVALNRDPDVHGVALDFTIGTLTFINYAASYIKAEYDSFGIEAKMILHIEEDCDTGTYTEFYKGNLNFGVYRDYTGTRCAVDIALETTGDVMTFNNRTDQKVNLESLRSFDNLAMPSYPVLGATMALPAKGIPVQNKGIVDVGTQSSEIFVGGLQAPYNVNEPVGIPTNLNINQLNIGLNKQVSSELGNFYIANPVLDQVFNGGIDGDFGETFIHHISGQLNPLGTPVYPLGSSPVVNYTQGSPSFGQLTGPSTIHVKFHGQLNNPNTYLALETAFLIAVLPFSTRTDFGTRDSDYIWLHEQMINDSVDPNDFVSPGGQLILDAETTIPYTFAQGDRLYIFITVTNRTTQAQIDGIIADSAQYALVATFDSTSFIQIDNLSKGGDNSISDIKSFMINESLSRVVESITDNKMRVLSNYFGRVDSLPYASGADGCGGLQMITNGLFIRGVDKAAAQIETQPILSVSMDDLFAGLNPIHNIGYGIEPDAQRPGFNVVRVEPWSYFYNPDIVFVCQGVETVTRSVDPSMCYSIFNFGYNKWEAQSYTGLDEFLTKRGYRTTLTSVQNTLSQLSSFVASGYAIEVTRRTGNDTTTDWTYDNDTFIICLKRGVAPLRVELVRGHNALLNKDVVIFGNFDAGSLAPGTSLLIQLPDRIESYTVLQSQGTHPVGESSYTVNQSMQQSHIPLNPGSIIGNVYIDGALVVDVAAIGVEQGGITTPTNMVDPETIYNFRISPVRNAMRWANKVFQSYRNLPDMELIFTDGEGNFYAKGYLPDACSPENKAVAENVTIDRNMFKNTEADTPLFMPETITFDYPLSAAEFNQLKNNRLGLIEYSTPQETGQGWIQNLQFAPKQGGGIGTFTLIRKYVAQ